MNINNPYTNPITTGTQNANLNLKIILLSTIAYFIAMLWYGFMNSVVEKKYKLNEMTTKKRFFISVMVTILVLLLGYFLFYIFKKGRKVEREIKQDVLE